MNFNLSERQSVWREKASRFANEELRPLWRELESSHGAVAAIYKRASARSLFDIGAPDGKDDGSSGILTATLMTEELSKGDCGFAVMFANRYLSSQTARVSISDDFRNNVLGIIGRSLEGTEIAFLWPRVTVIDRDVEGAARETPERADASWDDNLSYAHSSVEYFIGCCRIGPLTSPSNFQLVLAERNNVKILEDRQGGFDRDSMRLYRFQFGEAQGPMAAGRNEGKRYDRSIVDLLSERAILFSAIALGVARAAFEYALTYSGERIAFGRPIIQHQAVSLKLAEMYIALEAARLFLWETACRQEKGSSEAGQADAVLSYCQEVAIDVASKALQALGGHGYLRDHPAEKWMREVLFLDCLTTLS
jgi:alkylation response protein AidB-like acyl-CoA dehydrogenase